MSDKLTHSFFVTIMYLSDRVPFDLQTKLRAGTVSWSSLPYGDRLYYSEGFRGGGAPDEQGEDVALSAPEHVSLSDAAYDRTVAMYLAALDVDRARAGLQPLDDGGDVGGYLPDMSDLDTAPTSPAPEGAATLAVSEAVMVPVGVTELRSAYL